MSEQRIPLGPVTVVVDWQQLVESETIRKHGCKPPTGVAVGFAAMLLVGYGVPICVELMDAAAHLFDLRILGRSNDLFYVFGYAGIAAGLLVWPLARRSEMRWYENHQEVGRELERRFKVDS